MYNIIFLEWTENDIVAQAVIFFIAGFETTKTLLSFAIHELTVNPDVQKRLQIEIDELIAEKGDALDYSDLMKMKYMDMVVCGRYYRYNLIKLVGIFLCVQIYTCNTFMIKLARLD